jgi:O-antigen ligase
VNHFKSAIWPIGWAFILSMGWLLPNHYLPWVAFHMDAWISVVLLVASAVVLVVSDRSARIFGSAWIILLLAVIPVIQFGTGLVASSGNAWLVSAYLLGLSLAITTGARWESIKPFQLMDCLFLAIGIAAIVSVGLQLHQWLAMDLIDLWSMGGGGSRPYANIGQPNQLGTLLIWGLLAVMWANLRRYISSTTAIGAALFLLFGLALTLSRTAWIGVILLVLAGWHWRRLFRSRWMPWVLTGLAGAYFFIVWNLPSLSKSLYLSTADGDLDALARMSSDQRFPAWSLFIDAVGHRPWLGYGWNQVALAQATVAPDHPPLHVFFYQAHNLFLDLVLWCGLPIGLALTFWLVWWLWRRFQRVQHGEDAVLILFLIVIANHAMLEYPLHYAYFLLPVGLIMGALEQRLDLGPVVAVGRNLVLALWLFMAILLAIFIRDYMRVEESYRTLRFEWANIKTVPAKSPDVVLLTQWRDYFKAVRLEPTSEMAQSDVQLLLGLAGAYPNPGLFLKLAKSLALKDEPAEAALWLTRACNMVPLSQCIALKRTWAAQSKADPKMAAAHWPGG